MPIPSRTGPLAALALSLAAAAPPAPACPGDAAAAGPVRAVVEGLIAADNERDIGRVLGYYAPDAVLMPPGEPPVTERAGIQARYDALFRDFEPAIEGRIDDVCVDGSLAVVRGRNGGWLVGRGGGASRRLDDVYLMVLHRDESAGWRIGSLIWHPASALSR